MPLTLNTRPPQQNLRVTTDLDRATADRVGTVIAFGYPERDEFAFESDQFSIVAAAQGIASGRGLRGREAEVNQELEHRNDRRCIETPPV